MIGERAPRLEEQWTVVMPDNSKRIIFVEPGNRGDETYLLEQLRSLAGDWRTIVGDHLQLTWSPAVAR